MIEMSTPKRNSLLTPIALALFCLIVSASVALLRAQSAGPGAYVVAWNKGEVLLDGRGRTNSINVSPATGSAHLSFVTQDMPPGAGIAVHRHDRTEEILFIHAGRGTLILGDKRIEVKAGDTVFIPPGPYHGIENPDSALQVVAVVTPPGLEQAFREMFWKPGEEPKVLTQEQLEAIGLRFDSVNRRN